MNKPVVSLDQRKEIVRQVMAQIGGIETVMIGLRVLGYSRVLDFLKDGDTEINNTEIKQLAVELFKLLTPEQGLAIMILVLGEDLVREIVAWLKSQDDDEQPDPIPDPNPVPVPGKVKVKLVHRDTNPKLKVSAVYGLEQGVAWAEYDSDSREDCWIRAKIGHTVHLRHRSDAETYGAGDPVNGVILLPAEHKGARIVSMSAANGVCIETQHEQPFQYCAVQTNGYGAYNPAGGHCRLYDMSTGKPEKGIEFKKITGIATGLCRHQGHWVCCGYGEGIESSAGWFLFDHCFDVVDCGGRCIALFRDGRIQEVTGGKYGKIFCNTIERPYAGVWDGKILWVTTSNIDQIWGIDLITGRRVYDFGGDNFPNTDGGLFDTPISRSPDGKRKYMGRCIKGKGIEIYEIEPDESVPDPDPIPDPTPDLPLDMGPRVHDPDTIVIWNECGGPTHNGFPSATIISRHRNKSVGIKRERLVHANCQGEINRTKDQLIQFTREAAQDGCNGIGLDMESWAISEAVLKMMREVADMFQMHFSVYPKAQMAHGDRTPYFGTVENGMRIVGKYAHFIGLWSWKSFGNDFIDLIRLWRKAGVTVQIGVFFEQTRNNNDGNGKLSWESVVNMCRANNLVAIGFAMNHTDQGLKDKLMEKYA